MAEMEQFTIGAETSCSDGRCGKVSRVVVDPVARAVTHLVVEAEHRRGLAKLVPVDLVDNTTSETRLRCTRAEFDQLDAAEETEFLPGSSGYGGYGQAQAFSWPYYSLGPGSPGGIGMSMGMGGMGMENGPPSVTYETVPSGEVAIHRGERVHATDGEIGRVQGLVMNPGDHHVTHVLLQEGHLWGRKTVAIPISAVTGVDDGIRLTITKEEVQDLPPVSTAHPVE